jgi:D-aminoacyl-tRNA deacylase
VVASYVLPFPNPILSVPSMRVIIQRVTSANVTIDGQIKARIDGGLLALVGFEETDTPDEIAWLCGKLVRLRLFNDDQGVMNRSVQEAMGNILVISQFTLFASTKKGNRPSYTRAATSATAIPLYQSFLRQLAQDLGRPVLAGEFGADMQVALVNDGPVTILIDTKARE